MEQCQMRIAELLHQAWELFINQKKATSKRALLERLKQCPNAAGKVSQIYALGETLKHIVLPHPACSCSSLLNLVLIDKVKTMVFGEKEPVVWQGFDEAACRQIKAHLAECDICLDTKKGMWQMQKEFETEFLEQLKA